MHTKKIYVIAAALLLIFAACEQPSGPSPEKPPAGPQLTGIRIAEPPLMMIYAKGQAFDPSGLVVEALYSDESARALEAAEYKLDPVDTALTGILPVTVRAGNFTDEFYISVRNSASILTGITVTTPPKKLTYEFGQEFSKTGMKVAGVYSDGVTEDIAVSLAVIIGYDRGKRGSQQITVRVNNYRAENAFAVVVEIPAKAEVSISPKETWLFIKGRPFAIPGKFEVTVNANGTRRAVPGLGAECFSGYNSGQAGIQSLTFTLDKKTVPFPVFVLDVGPELYFDYGFMRHAGNPNGYGPNRDAWDGDGGGRYYVQPGQKLVIAPVRFLLGYDADHTDGVVTWNWTVNGPGTGTHEGLGTEFLRFTASGAGTWDITVTATGRNFVTGTDVPKTAYTKIICFAEPYAPANADPWHVKNYAPGQFTEGGAGLSWSLGAYGGYEAWKLNGAQSSVMIKGNAFTNWVEPGVVWVMGDDNGNGLPDETWYELRGSDDDDPRYRPLITRRLAMRYVRSSDTGGVNEYGQLIKAVYTVDAKGRTRSMGGGWPTARGVPGDWVVYTGTMLRDSGNPDERCAGNMPGYVDAIGVINFSVSNAIYPDGTPVSPGLGAIRFVKVHTGVFKFPGGGVGEVSTEIYEADTIGMQSGGFPLPEDS